MDAVTKRCDSLAPTLMMITTERNQLAKEKAALIQERDKLRAALDASRRSPTRPHKPTMLEQVGDVTPPPSDDDGGSITATSTTDANSRSVLFEPAERKSLLGSIPTDLTAAKAFFLGTEQYKVQYVSSQDAEYDAPDEPQVAFTPDPLSPLPTPLPPSPSFDGVSSATERWFLGDEARTAVSSHTDCNNNNNNNGNNNMVRTEGAEKGDRTLEVPSTSPPPSPTTTIDSISALDAPELTLAQILAETSMATTTTEGASSTSRNAVGNATPEEKTSSKRDKSTTKATSTKRSLFSSLFGMGKRATTEVNNSPATVTTTTTTTNTTANTGSVAQANGVSAENPWFDSNNNNNSGDANVPPQNVMFLTMSPERNAMANAKKPTSTATVPATQKGKRTKRSSMMPSRAKHDASVELRAKIAEAEQVVALARRRVEDAKWESNKTERSRAEASAALCSSLQP